MRNRVKCRNSPDFPYRRGGGDRDGANPTGPGRRRPGEDLGAMSLADFTARLREDVDTKAIW